MSECSTKVWTHYPVLRKAKTRRISLYVAKICIGDRDCVFFFQAEDGIRDTSVTGVQTCALPISGARRARLRLRLPDERGAGGEAVRGARLLARRRHDRGLLGGPHGPPRRVAALRRSEERRVGKEEGRSRGGARG